MVTRFFLFSLLLMGLPCAGFADEAQWIPAGMASMYVEYYSPSKVECLPEGIVKVWSKKVFNKEGVALYVKEIDPKYKDLDYVLTYTAHDCVNRKSAILKMIEYSKNGDVLYEKDIEEQRWLNPPPDSSIDALFKKACGSCNK